MSVDWAEETPTPDLVKQTVTLWDVCDMCDIEVNSQGKITSPYNPDERTPSCQIHDDFFYDFSSGRHGDVIEFVQALDPDLSFGRALRRLWNKALKAGREPGDVERSQPRGLVDFSRDVANGLPAINFGELNPPANCREDYDGNLLIPHKDEDGIYGVKVRAPNGAKSAWPGSQFTKRLYHQWGWRFPRDFVPGPAIITEGESDAWALARFGLVGPALFALPSGAGAFREHWLEDLEPYDDILLAFDNDRAGQEATTKWLAKLGKRVRVLPVPGLAKDVREAIAMFPNWRPAEYL